MASSGNCVDLAKLGYRGSTCFWDFTTLIDAVPWARANLRPLHADILQAWNRVPAGLARKFPVSLKMKLALRWWLTNHQVGISFSLQQEAVLTINTSSPGWGTHIPDA